MKDAKHARNGEPDLGFGHIPSGTNPASVSECCGEGVHGRELLSVDAGVHETIGIEAGWFRERFWVMKNCPELPVGLLHKTETWYRICVPCIPDDQCSRRNKVSVILVILGDHVRKA